MKVFCDGSGSQICYVAVGETSQVTRRGLGRGLTHNENEYLAILYALNLLTGDLEIYSDSELAVNQINTLLGREKRRGKMYRIKEPRLQVLADRVVECIARREQGKPSWGTTIEWVRREDNLAGRVLG